MTLLEIAKKFSDGFKEGWSECQADDNTSSEIEDLSEVRSPYEELNDSYEVPAYDDVYSANHQSYYPEHRIYK